MFVWTVTEEPHQSQSFIPALHARRRAREPQLKDYLYEAFTSTYLLRYPCHPSRVSRWPRRIPALSILTGRRSARRSDRGRTSRCCCTAPGSRLSTHRAHVREPERSTNEGNQEEWVEDSEGWAFRVDRGQGWGGNRDDRRQFFG